MWGHETIPIWAVGEPENINCTMTKRLKKQTTDPEVPKHPGGRGRRKMCVRNSRKIGSLNQQGSKAIKKKTQENKEKGGTGGQNTIFAGSTSREAKKERTLNKVNHTLLGQGQKRSPMPRYLAASSGLKIGHQTTHATDSRVRYKSAATIPQLSQTQAGTGTS